MACERPALRWHGGKWLLAPWIISHFPKHRAYVEPFGGAASVLIQKPRSYAEIYNDLDDGVTNFFRVLRNESDAARLVEMLTLTPFARREFDAAYAPTTDPVEFARRLVVRSYMGFGSDGHNPTHKTGFRANSNRSGTTPAQDWANYPPALAQIVERWRGVIVENRPALDVMRQHDAEETLHYVDPPYVHETRSKKSRQSAGVSHAYQHEMSREAHAELLEALLTLEGYVILSGYPHPLYDEALRGWRRVTKAALADGAKKRVEVLWINPRAAAHLQPTLFAEVA